MSSSSSSSSTVELLYLGDEPWLCNPVIRDFIRLHLIESIVEVSESLSEEYEIQQQGILLRLEGQEQLCHWVDAKIEDIYAVMKTSLY